jgi:hypothetical protein
VVNCIAFMLGALLAGGAQHYRLFLLGRFVSGIGEQQQVKASSSSSSRARLAAAAAAAAAAGQG